MRTLRSPQPRDSAGPIWIGAGLSPQNWSMSRTVATLAKQCESLKAYLRVLRANVRRGGAEVDAGHMRRMRYPLEGSLTWRRYQDARDLLLIGEACLQDLMKATALRVAPFQPGDQILATLTEERLPSTDTRYAVWDIKPESRGRFSYQVMSITKRGALSKRFCLHTLMADTRHSIRVCSDALDDETAQSMRWRRDVAKTFLDDVINKGSLAAYEMEEVGYLRHRQVKRSR